MSNVQTAERYIPEQQPNGQWRIRDLRDDELRIIAVRFESEAIRRAELLNRDFTEAEW